MIRIEERIAEKIPGITSLFLTFDYNKNIIEEIKQLQSYNFDAKKKHWEIPANCLSECLDRLCTIDEIEFIPEQVIRKSQLINSCDVSKINTKLFDYQEDGVKFGLNHDSWLLLDAPGLGKSLQLIALAQNLKDQGKVNHCLILCGLNTLKTNWRAEIQKHSQLSCRILGERVNRNGRYVIDGIPARLEQLKNPIDEFFCITNIETIRDDKIIAELTKGKNNKFDMIIVDEIHRCKNSTSQQGKNLLKLSKAKYKIGATGTLLLNNPLDTYLPLKWIGAEHANFSTFKYYYCKYGGLFNQELIGYKNMDVLKDQIDTFSLRRTKDILNLPEKTIINEFVDMDDDQEKFYSNIKDGIIDQVDKVKMTPANILAMAGRLRQATALPDILTTDQIKSAKIQRAVDLATQIAESGDKVVIFSTFKQPVYELQKQLKEYNPVIGTGDCSDQEIEEAKQKFQNCSDNKIFLGTWQKCGTGITLTAASYMIFIDVPWTQGDYNQAQDRIYRIGTKNAVTIYHLITKNTIDERVLEIVEDKGYLADYIIDDTITQNGLKSLQKYIEEIAILS